MDDLEYRLDRPTYERPMVVSYEEEELSASVEAFGPSIPGGP